MSLNMSDMSDLAQTHEKQAFFAMLLNSLMSLNSAFC
jgi:hypothetical protein